MTGPSDAEAIVGSLEDPDRFDEIYRRYRDDIFRFVARRIGPDDAPDITADVFVRAFRVRDRYDPSRPDARPWLYGIATNVVGDHRRRMQIRRSRTESIAVSWLERDAEFSDLVAADADAVSQRAQLVTALRSRMQRDLHPRHRVPPARGWVHDGTGGTHGHPRNRSRQCNRPQPDRGI